MTTKDEVSMPVFSMNLPFAALFANGYKTLESRNGTMFTPYEPGTKMLLHVGRRTYPDGGRHLQIMASGVEAVPRLPVSRKCLGVLGRG
jgi:hypothetical protein